MNLGNVVVKEAYLSISNFPIYLDLEHSGGQNLLEHFKFHQLPPSGNFGKTFSHINAKFWGYVLEFQKI